MRFTAKTDARLLDLLQARFPESSKTSLRDMLRHGRVAVDGTVAKRADIAVQAGQAIEIAPRRGAAGGRSPSAGSAARVSHAAPPRTESAGAQPPGRILLRDEHLLAIEKPAGLLSVSREGGEDTFYRRMNRFVSDTSNGRERILIVHRLDRGASGVMLFALSPRIQERLQRAWKQTEKRYMALVEGRPRPPEGTIRNWLRENRVHRMYSTSRPGPGAKEAVTHYRVRRSARGLSLVEVEIETGRKNQIRAHLSELGCPIVGDRKYGALTNPLKRLGLHAFLLAFTHPVTGERIRLRLPLPRAFRLPAGMK